MRRVKTGEVVDDPKIIQDRRGNDKIKILLN